MYRRVFQIRETKNIRTIISELRDKFGRSFTKREQLEQICLDFYKNLYQHKNVSKNDIRKILVDLQMSFTVDTNASFSKKITDKELSSAVHLMAKGKTPGHNEIPMEFFQKYGDKLEKILRLLVW